MTFKHLPAVVLCCICLSSSGCATILTSYFPVKVKETKQGEKILGNPVAYNYSLTERTDSFVLLRQPLCSQHIKLIAVEKKMVHGIVFAMLEVPFFGFGLFDMAMAQAASKDSVKESDAGTVNSGEIVACGNDDPASNMDLLLEFPESISVTRTRTDGQGRVTYSFVKNILVRDSHYIVFVR